MSLSNRLSHRFSRWIALSGLGVDVVRGRMFSGGTGPESEAADLVRRQRLATRMASLRGIPQKLGQILSLRELEGDTDVFGIAAEGGNPVPGAEAREWIVRELQRPLSEVFSRFDDAGTGASIGQVHRAWLVNGQPVAVKIQYPGLEQTLDADLAAIGLLASPISRRAGSFDLGAYRTELRRAITEELDYRREAAALTRFAARSQSMPWLETPVPIETLCTERLLTMTWIDGESFRELQQWKPEDRAAAGTLFVRFFLRSLLSWGELHGDPHPGNFRCRLTDGGVVLGVLDFGCVKVLSDAERHALCELLLSHRELRPQRALELYVQLGFDRELLEPLADRLPNLTGILAEPFHAAEPFDADEWRLSERIEELLGDDRWNFRFAGPASLLFFIRALSGLFVQLGALKVKFSWADELTAVLSEASSGSGGGAPVQAVSDAPAGDEQRARHLRIAVHERGEVKVQLTFRSESIEWLDELIPPEVLEKLSEQAIDVMAIARTALDGGTLPQELFSLDDQGKRVRVWLE